MIRLIASLILIAGLLPGPVHAAKGCNTTWTKGSFKSFRQIESEVRAAHGDVKILRVLLCGEGANAYFQVVVLNRSGTVQNLRIAAK